jgi:hypothetical protein
VDLVEVVLSHCCHTVVTLLLHCCHTVLTLYLHRRPVWTWWRWWAMRPPSRAGYRATRPAHGYYSCYYYYLFYYSSVSLCLCLPLSASVCLCLPVSAWVTTVCACGIGDAGQGSGESPCARHRLWCHSDRPPVGRRPGHGLLWCCYTTLYSLL